MLVNMDMEGLRVPTEKVAIMNDHTGHLVPMLIQPAHHLVVLSLFTLRVISLKPLVNTLCGCDMSTSNMELLADQGSPT